MQHVAQAECVGHMLPAYSAADSWSVLRRWQGLLRLQASYPHNHRLSGGCWRIGWFQAPGRFSRAAAQLPIDSIDRLFYPACFFVWDREELYMACEAILLQRSRPWPIHPSRMANSRPVQASEVSVVLRILFFFDSLKASFHSLAF